LLIKSGQESLSTIDICSIDLHSGIAMFYKAGAAPTLIFRSGKVSYIRSSSLPAGILQGVGFDKSTTSLRSGDIILMLSDGVTATGSEWLASELQSQDKTDMEQLAQAIAETSRYRRIDGREDDITVIAMRVEGV
jgi:stage II sporulation protein E